MKSFLAGYRTYIVATLLVLVSVVNFLSGDMDITTLLNDPNILVLLNGIGLATLRAGVSK